MEHGDGDGAEDGSDDDIRQEDGEQGRGEEPDKDLVLHRGADAAERLDGDPSIQSCGRPCKADEIGA